MKKEPALFDYAYDPLNQELIRQSIVSVAISRIGSVAAQGSD